MRTAICAAYSKFFQDALNIFEVEKRRPDDDCASSPLLRFLLQYSIQPRMFLSCASDIDISKIRTEQREWAGQTMTANNKAKKEKAKCNGIVCAVVVG